MLALDYFCSEVSPNIFIAMSEGFNIEQMNVIFPEYTQQLL